MILIILFLSFLSAFIIAYVVVPSLMEGVKAFNRKRSERLVRKMDAMYLQSREKRMLFFYVLAPFFLGFAGFFFAPAEVRLIATGAGIAFGFILPNFYFKFLAKQRKKKFYDQLIDALMMMNSGLKGGLSLLQAMEAVADEMPEPISQEFAILIGENKIGVSLEASFDRLYQRVGSPALQQFISAVLLARETGGNLPVIFNRIIATIRENRKIEQNIQNLTLQGRIQGVVMSLLPVAFALFVYSSNPNYFDPMLQSKTGQNLLILCGILEVVGTGLIYKFSKIGDF